MNPPTVIPGSISPLAFLGYPPVLFRFEERRSLTVHLEDAGWYDVWADAGPNDHDDSPVFAGRYHSFDDARAVCNRLNGILRLTPQSTPREVMSLFPHAS